ncbi:MAG: macro domain-containing protein, partial [Chlorobia bacterium]|nr:macro domain-containing protein [Fimbriimonadaceae bacterium]
MIERGTGSLLDSDVEALVNTVNTVGVMGKGIALQFKQAFPKNFIAYEKACRRGEVVPGHMFVFASDALMNPRFIINFPTKRHWKGSARLADIKTGLDDLVNVIKTHNIKSLAVPPLGCGLGGLRWDDVRPLIETALGNLDGVKVVMFAPGGAPAADSMQVATKKPAMTEKVAALLHVFRRYGVPGYKLTRIEAQKLAYFLQVVGVPLRLEFAKYTYGPYAEKLNHWLQRLDGHYIRGYGDRTQNSPMV